MGGGVLVASVAFLTTMVIYRVNRVLNRIGLPFFFQQVAGGLVAATPAATLYTFQDQLGVEIRPSQIISAGVVVLLSGLSLVGSVQDAITGAPITAAARFFEVVMMTGGIIAGVAISLRLTGVLGSTLPPVNVEITELVQLPVLVMSGAFASMFYALACYAEQRALTAAWFGGAAGAWSTWWRTSSASAPIIGSALAATVVGFAGGLMARRALTPPLVVVVAGITPLLPGLSLYRGPLRPAQQRGGDRTQLAAGGVRYRLRARGGRHARRVDRPDLRRPRILRRTDDIRRPVFKTRRRKPVEAHTQKAA